MSDGLIPLCRRVGRACASAERQPLPRTGGGSTYVSSMGTVPRARALTVRYAARAANGRQRSGLSSGLIHPKSGAVHRQRGLPFWRGQVCSQPVVDRTAQSSRGSRPRAWWKLPLPARRESLAIRRVASVPPTWPCCAPGTLVIRACSVGIFRPSSETIWEPAPHGCAVRCQPWPAPRQHAGVPDPHPARYRAHPSVLARGRRREPTGRACSPRLPAPAAGAATGCAVTRVGGSRHTTANWRALVPSMPEWMTPALARAASRVRTHLVHSARSGGPAPAVPASSKRTAVPSPRSSG